MLQSVNCKVHVAHCVLQSVSVIAESVKSKNKVKVMDKETNKFVCHYLICFMNEKTLTIQNKSSTCFFL